MSIATTKQVEQVGQVGQVGQVEQVDDIARPQPYINKSKTNSHGTPDYIINNLNKQYGGKLSSFDPCPLNDNPTFDGTALDCTVFISRRIQTTRAVILSQEDHVPIQIRLGTK